APGTAAAADGVAVVRPPGTAARSAPVVAAARVPTVRPGDRHGCAGPAGHKACSHDSNTCREAEARLDHGSSPAGGKDLQRRADCILARACPAELYLRSNTQI